MKVVAIVSGGMDSVAMLYGLAKSDEVAEVLTFHYGQRHSREIEFARAAAMRLNLPHRIVPLRVLGEMATGSSLTDATIEVPEGHYADESMKATVVPNRNMVMLSIAAARAISLKADAVAYAAHAGDHTIYPDCRPEFVEAMRQAFQLMDWHPVRLFAPFIGSTKADIVRLGARRGVPFELTWSCYKGGRLHCGKCGTCVERREAFEVAGYPDPTEYES